MELNDSLTVFLTAALGLIATIITVVGPVVRQRLEVWAHERMQEVYEYAPDYVDRMIQRAAEIAVVVVEATNLEGASKDKLKQAEEIAEKWLSENFRYDIELDRIREAIEYVLFEKKKDGSL